MITIYHNPDCSNSRGALALLRAAAIEPVIVEYLKTPLTVEALRALAVALSRNGNWPGLREGMLRVKEPVYAQLGLDGADDDALLAAVAAHPVLLNRPIVVTAKGARLCRPPERVREIL